MILNEQLLMKSIQSQVSSSSISKEGAEQYADDLCKYLFDESEPVLSSHYIDIENKFVHDSGETENHGLSVVFNISYDSDDVCRPTMSSRKKYPDANMLILFDIGWDIAKSHQIKEWDKTTHKPIHSRLHYDGDQYIKEACDKFNASAPPGVFAQPVIY